MYIVQEYCEGINLNKYLKENSNLPESKLKLIYKDLVMGLKYLHSIGIAHRDIKLDNIMVCKHGD